MLLKKIFFSIFVVVALIGCQKEELSTQGLPKTVANAEASTFTQINPNEYLLSGTYTGDLHLVFNNNDVSIPKKDVVVTINKGLYNVNLRIRNFVFNEYLGGSNIFVKNITIKNGRVFNVTSQYGLRMNFLEFPLIMNGKFTREDGKNYLEFDMSSEFEIFYTKMTLKGTFRGVRTKLEP
mgnify:CR=1 FL=1